MSVEIKSLEVTETPVETKGYDPVVYQLIQDAITKFAILFL